MDSDSYSDDDSVIGSPVPLAPEAALKAMRSNSVVAKIAKNLPTKELWDLRETCHSWNNCFIPQLGCRPSKGPIRLHVAPEPPRQFEHAHAIEDFVAEATKSSIVHLFTNYHISDPTFEYEAMDALLSLCGPFIRTLGLAHHYEDEPPMELNWIREFVFERTPELRELLLRADTDPRVFYQPFWSKTDRKMRKQLPKLRKFTYAILGELDPGHGGIVAEILESATELECLVVDNEESNFQAISAVRGSLRNLDKLKSLQMKGLRLPELRILAELVKRPKKPLRLTEFETFLELWTEEREWPQITTLFHDFLAPQANTLQKFEIQVTAPPRRGRKKDIPPPPLRFPRLDELESFTFIMGGRQPGFVTFGGFPKLRRLDYRLSPLDNDQNLEANDEMCAEHLSQLASTGVTELLLDIPPVTHAAFGRLQQLMPLVSHLELVLNSDPATPPLLAMLWSLWPALVSLQVSMSTHNNYTFVEKLPELNLDSWLTGVPTSSLAELKLEFEAGMAQELDATCLRTLVAKFKTETGLSNLTHLQRFTFRYTSWQPVSLTDIGGYFGLALANPRMRFMDVSVQRTKGKEPMMTSVCKQFIKDTFRPCAIIELKL